MLNGRRSGKLVRQPDEGVDLGVVHRHGAIHGLLQAQTLRVAQHHHEVVDLPVAQLLLQG